MTKYERLSRKLLAELNLRKEEIAQFRQPIAIVGMACRFPGGEGLASYWRQLEEGRCTVTEGRPGSVAGAPIAGSRPGSEAQDARRWGSFVREIDRFDADFFRIAPVEARLLDPQQRMLLETSWHALEEAGIDPSRLVETRTGVYAGISTSDYRALLAAGGEQDSGLYAVSGVSGSTAIGRVAFVLGLQGPAIAVDTACSSSLVALHQACVALQQGEADLALAGGVNAILAPSVTEATSKAGMLAPDGRCKTFDASANGFVRGEGCGIVVLKRLANAEADGDRIWAVIPGSAVNHDGASAGLTVPNGPAQEKVIAEALARAGLEPADVDYLEAHGTGTELGDPIEVHAASSTYGSGRRAGRPLLIGSVKTNIGHLESAAGVAGLIKVVLSMDRGVIPKHLHFRNPNPRIAWEHLPVEVTSEALPWPSFADRPWRAGLSSFGFSGTNAHMLIEAYGRPRGRSAQTMPSFSKRGLAVDVPVSLPAQAPALAAGQGPLAPREQRLLPLSGRSSKAVRELASRYLAWLQGRESEALGEEESRALLADMAWTAGLGRTHFDRRAGLVCGDLAELRSGLEEVVAGREIARAAQEPQVAFVFTGQGSQWAGMGRWLYEREPVARAVLDRCEQVMQELRGASLLDVMFGEPSAAGSLDETEWTQPTLYALECALAAQWASVGVRPAAVLGHSVGEIAAAQAAGVFGLEDGLRFATARGESMGSLPTEGPAAGAMLAVFAPQQRVAEALAEHNAGAAGAGLSLAADNGTHRVVSGPRAELEAIAEHFEPAGVRVAWLNTSHAFHSALMDPALDDIEGALEAVAPRSPAVPLVSNVAGRAMRAGEQLDGAYWRRQAREPVAFAAGVAALAEIGAEVVIEIGPQAVLGPLVEQAWPAGNAGGAESRPAVLGSLRREEGAAGGFAAAAAAAYEAGVAVSFEHLFAGESRRRVSLPVYPFQRERFWVDPLQRPTAGEGHALLGARRESARGGLTFETEMYSSAPAWLGDHRVFGMVVAPGALYGVLGVEVAASAAGEGAAVLEDLQLHEPLVWAQETPDGVAGGEGRSVQVFVDGDEGASPRVVEVYSRAGSEAAWQLHATARVLRGRADTGGAIDPKALREGLSSVDSADFYRGVAERGIEYGALFRGLAAVWSGPGEALGEVVLPPEADRGEMWLHPAQLDACFQVVGTTGGDDGDSAADTFMPFGWERLWLAGPLPDRVLCHARTRQARRAGGAGAEASEVQVVDLGLYDQQGMPLGGVSGLVLKRATRAALLSAVEGVDDLLYEVVWRERPQLGGPQSADFLAAPGVVGELRGSFAENLEAEGAALESWDDLLAGLAQLSQSYALAGMDALGWHRETGAIVEPEPLRRQLRVVADHRQLFRRLLEMLEQAGILQAQATESPSWVVTAGSGEPLPEGVAENPRALGAELLERHPAGSQELGLLMRCGDALADVLAGRVEPLELLFGGENSGAAGLYHHSPGMRAANRTLGAAVGLLAAGLPERRRLRVLEVGAGTGSATAQALQTLPKGRFEYLYTDISAGFFAEAEERFGAEHAGIDYRVLDIEADPEALGLDAHGHDLIIAANVLHATRDLEKTLENCRRLLAPAGLLVALETFRPQEWMDLTFGLLEGWWRFSDRYRSEHAMAGEAAWRQALKDAGFGDAEVLQGCVGDVVWQGVIVARGPLEVDEAPGLWVLAGNGSELAQELAGRLATRNQTVVVAGQGTRPEASPHARITSADVDPAKREAWRALLEGLPADARLRGVVHLGALDERGNAVTAAELAECTARIGKSALALVQGLQDAGAEPLDGLWFVTRGGQVVKRDQGGELAGATLWGLGKAVALEAHQLRPRMVDLDPREPEPLGRLVDELLHADRETHVAHRGAGPDPAPPGSRAGDWHVPPAASWTPSGPSRPGWRRRAPARSAWRWLRRG